MLFEDYICDLGRINAPSNVIPNVSTSWRAPMSSDDSKSVNRSMRKHSKTSVWQQTH